MDRVAFTTPGVLRIFLACQSCGRMVPHYRVYGYVQGRCRCGHATFVPTLLPEWKAAWYVLVVGWLWRKTLRRCAEWDPRMPVREGL